MKSTIHAVIASSLFLSVLGCSAPSSFLESKKIDYKSAGQIQPLEVPPDLTAPPAVTLVADEAQTSQQADDLMKRLL